MKGGFQGPRISVLLPTRGAAAQLDSTLRSVLGQDYADFELVVSDNANEDETPEVLAAYAADARLKVLRQSEPLSVTENWNATLRASSGQYVVHVGDDDALLPGYFESADRLLRDAGEPDVLLYNGYTYVAPGAVGESSSLYRGPRFEPPAWWPEHGRLSPKQRTRLLRDIFRFRTPVTYDNQLLLVSRGVMERLPAGLYQPPFPDHYAIGALLVAARAWAYSQERLAVVGVSPKSFGHSFQVGLDDDTEFGYLGESTEFEGKLPGNVMLNALHAVMLALKRDFPDQLSSLEVSRSEYVLRQVWSWIKAARRGELARSEVVSRLRGLPPRDLVWAVLALRRPRTLGEGARALSRINRPPSDALGPLKDVPEVSDIAEFAEWEERRREPLPTA